MPNTVLKFKCKTWTDESLKDPNFKKKLINPKGKVCPELKVIRFDTERKRPHKRWSTERWLEEMIREFDINFQDFITISFHQPNKDIVDQSLLGKHIKKVILDFFYKKNKPINMINIWIFIEREGMFFRQGKNLEKEPIIKTKATKQETKINITKNISQRLEKKSIINIKDLFNIDGKF